MNAILNHSTPGETFRRLSAGRTLGTTLSVAHGGDVRLERASLLSLLWLNNDVS